MATLVDKITKVTRRGVTGGQGAFQPGQAIACGTQMVAGVSPGEGGGTQLNRPAFGPVRGAVTATGADTPVRPALRGGQGRRNHRGAGRGMMRGIALALAVVGASATGAAAQASPENLALATAGAQACAAHLPDARATSAALKSAGFQLREANGQMKVYTDPRVQVAVGFTALRASNGTRSEAGCLVAVHRMTPAEAGRLIQPWIKAAGATPVAPAQNISERWLGTYKGSTILMGVLPSSGISIIRGAAIVAAVPN